ncbi:MAG: hypothetical protein P1T08_12795 [Acidimicrobiia bacterium]|nr:hypothetical protein [Acidimicrobiia bacterium]
MADVRLTAEPVTRTGLAAAYTTGLSIANTYLVRLAGKTMLHFKKSGAGACVVTLETPGQVGGLAVEDPTVSVPATTGDLFVELPPHLFADGSNDARFTLSEVTGLSVAVLQLT